MFRALLIASALFASTHASASFQMNELSLNLGKAVFSDVETRGLNWAVGDTANYKLDIGGFIKGTMEMIVKSVNGSEAVLTQNMSVMGQAQNCEMTLNLNTGEVKSMVCNGQNQETGGGDDVEVIETKADTVTVPAGTFECLYIKAHSKKQNADIEQWANPKLIPVLGMAKALMPSQVGKVTIELASFKKM